MNKRKLSEKEADSGHAGNNNAPTNDPGTSRLMEMLDKEAERKGMSRADLANALGVTYSYLSQLTSGRRLISQASESFARRCGEFLGMPKISILLISGRLSISDFYLVNDKTYENDLKRALRFIKDDAQYGPMFPPELLLDTTSEAIKAYVVFLYERATGRNLIGEKLDFIDVQNGHATVRS